MLEYSEHYDFELQLLAESFCRRVVDQAVHSSKETSKSQQMEHEPFLHHVVDEDCVDDDEEEDAEVGDSGPHTTAGDPESVSTKFLSPREIPMCLETAERVGRAIWPQPDSTYLNKKGHLDLLIRHYLDCSGPLFETVQHAKAYLQQAHLLSEREAFARRAIRSSVDKWIRLVAPHVRSLHKLAASSREELLRLHLREEKHRRAIAEECDVHMSVLRFMSTVESFHGDAKAVRLLSSAIRVIYDDEGQWRSQAVAEELATRAEIVGSRSLEKQRLCCSNGSSMYRGGGLSSSLPLDADSSARPPSRIFELSRPHTAISTMHSVDVRQLSAARIADQLSSSFDRARYIRGESEALQDLYAIQQKKRIAASIAKIDRARVASAARKLQVAEARSSRLEEIRTASRLETFACEREAYEGRHPQAASAVERHLLHRGGTLSNSCNECDHDATSVKTTSACWGISRSQQKPGSSATSPGFKARLYSSMHCAAATYKVLTNHDASSRETIVVKRSSSAKPRNRQLLQQQQSNNGRDSVSPPPRGRSASEFLRVSSSSGVRTSQKEVLMQPEEEAVREISALHEKMLELKGKGVDVPVQADEPPIASSSDEPPVKSEADLLRDDVTAESLSQLERILRWNLRAQMAVRRGDVASAQRYVDSAFSSIKLINQERRRSRAARMSLVNELGPHPEDPKKVMEGISIRNLTMLTYSTAATVSRHTGRLKDALTSLSTVLSLEEGGGEDDEDTDSGAKPRTLISTSAILAQLDRGEESLRFARRALFVLRRQCARDTAACSEVPIGKVHGNLFSDLVAALLNVAIAQCMMKADSSERTAAKKTCEAAISLAARALPGDHPLQAAAAKQAVRVGQLLTAANTQLL